MHWNRIIFIIDLFYQMSLVYNFGIAIKIKLNYVLWI